MTNIISLFSGIGIIIDESLNEEVEGLNRMQKIASSLKEQHIPIIPYTELPDKEDVPHLHSVSFIILDWNLSGIQPIPEATIDDNIEFIKSLRSCCYVPIFIFSDP